MFGAGGLVAIPLLILLCGPLILCALAGFLILTALAIRSFFKRDWLWGLIQLLLASLMPIGLVVYMGFILLSFHSP